MNVVVLVCLVLKKLIERWTELEKCFIDEVGYDCGKGRSAPSTYKLIRSIID